MSHRSCGAGIAFGVAWALCVSCGGGGGGGSPAPPPTPPPAPPSPPNPGTTLTARFVDATAESGIRYRHAYINPTQGSETEEFGGGVAAGDYDGDGLEDLFVLRGDIGNNLLYRNLGDNRFRDMSHEAGVAMDPDTHASLGSVSPRRRQGYSSRTTRMPRVLLPRLVNDR